MKRRAFLTAASLVSLFGASTLFALTEEDAPFAVDEMLDGAQSDRFRAWIALMVADQIKQGPSPRWVHRDCAGLLRFAVSEAFATHDEAWQRANGFLGKSLPPDIGLNEAQKSLKNRWKTFDDGFDAFASALAIAQKNSRFLGRDLALAKRGDFLLFDQGDEQHLMIFMGDKIVYHTGKVVFKDNPKKSVQKETPKEMDDNGLRAVTPQALFAWKDSRWRITHNNPNFVGFYRLAFLSR